MDDDYNTLGEGLHDDELQYPDAEELFGDGARNDEPLPTTVVPSAIDFLNESEVRKRAPLRRLLPTDYPPDDVYIHPIDWHMRVPDFDEIRFKEWQEKRELEMAVNRLADKVQKYREVVSRESGDCSAIQQTIDMNDIECRHPAEIMSSPPIDGTPWMGISADGNEGRYYIRLIRARFSTSEQNCGGKARQSRAIAFASQPIFQLVQEAEQIRLKKEAQTSTATKRNEFDNDMDVLPNTSALVDENSASKESTKALTSLWVDKHKPKGYADLLSDDGVNRTLMTWIKLWDECVFKKKNAVESIIGEKEREMFIMDDNKPRRPHHKIILLSGPAGLGKTTLANVIARHAGYTVTEVNASDNRNISDFEKVLEGSVRSVRTLDQDQRPQCLVIDEIDGAPGDAVRWLVRQLQAPGKKAIRRPIIAICNNLFAPALRELRSIALSVQMTPTKRERLVERLSTVCEREGVSVDRSVLLRLAEMCGCDMRLSLNTLQYVGTLAKSNNRSIGEDEIVKAVERERPMSCSIFDQWALILEINKHLDHRGVVQAVSDRVHAIERLAMDHGDERFVSGLHHNYARQHPPLPIATVRRAADHFVYYDHVNKTVQETQNYILMRYLVVFYVQLHLTVATHTRTKLSFPQIDTTIAQKRRENQESIGTVRSRLFGAGLPPTVLICDILPLLVTITQPNIKPMNQSLYGSRDREQMRTVVRIMTDYGITFTPNSINNQLQYLYQPSIDFLTMFPLNGEPLRMFMSNAVRQMVAHEIELEKMRYNSSGTHVDMLELPNVEKENKEDRGRKRAWKSSPFGKYKEDGKKYRDHHCLDGILFDYHPCHFSAVKTKITLGQFLGF